MTLETAKPLKGVLRYPGGKQRAVGDIIARFPKDGWDRYLEPMVGGASVFLAARQACKTRKEWWINDKFYDLYCFWTAAQSEFHNTEIRRLAFMAKAILELDVIDKEEWFKSLKDRNVLMTYMDGSKLDTIMYEAVRFFIVNRCSYSGTTLAGGFSAMAAESRFTKSSIDRVALLPPILKDVMITHGDWSVLTCKSEPTDFMFLDPPYVTARKLYGDNGELHKFDHAGLADELKSAKFKFLMTYDDCPEVRALYRGFKMETWSLQYSMTGSHNGKRRKGSELFISNY